MKQKLTTFILLLVCMGIQFSINGCKEGTPVIDLKVKDQEKKVDVLIDGILFTSYIYPDNIKKPVLWPLISPQENELTRCYPMKIKEGERVDHPHHIGIWLNYGDVNGLDFWNNSDAIPEDKRNGYGTIKHRSIERAEGGKGHALLEITADWTKPDNTVLLKEKTHFRFLVAGNIRLIDRTTQLTAISDSVKFTDNKEGVFAIRVAREFEMPSEDTVEMTDAHGVVTKITNMDNSKVTGNYHSSEGVDGEDVWGTRGRWMRLSGIVNNEQVSIIIIDHPKNVGYPTYWHARGYGLFSANTLGQKIFSDGKEELNYSLKKGETLTLRYRLAVGSGILSDEEINKLADEYSKELSDE